MTPRNRQQDDEGETSPLLGHQHRYRERYEQHEQNGHLTNNTHTISFKSESSSTNDNDEDLPLHPRSWPFAQKCLQISLIWLIAFLLPSASSIFAPATSNLSTDLGVPPRLVLLGQTVFVAMLGVGPLILAPLSETVGRRKVFLGGLVGFVVLQAATAGVRNLGSWVVVRLLSGFCGSVGVANGGGTVSDLFETHERAKVLGVYLVAPLLGPTVGPMIGGLVVGSFHWRWIFWGMFAISAVLTIICYFFLQETRAQTVLQNRRADLEKKNPGVKYEIEGEESGGQSLLGKVAANSTRAIRILTTQPIVMIMSLYQALVFSSMYSLYSQYSTLWAEPPYDFSKTQIGLAYLGPAIGFIVTAVFIVLFIDRVYVYLAKRNDDDGQPEYRLPMANVGAVFLPISLFWFGWTIEKDMAWPIPFAATLLFGASQVSIFNTIQTYYIDAYESHAASAIAAGAFLRSVVGGIVPLFVSGMFDALGYGWGMSVFGILSVILMPAPSVFYWIGRRLRERVPFKG